MSLARLLTDEMDARYKAMFISEFNKFIPNEVIVVDKWNDVHFWSDCSGGAYDPQYKTTTKYGQNPCREVTFSKFCFNPVLEDIDDRYLISVATEYAANDNPRTQDYKATAAFLEVKQSKPVFVPFDEMDLLPDADRPVFKPWG